jgi:hypothetical protein
MACLTAYLIYICTETHYEKVSTFQLQISENGVTVLQLSEYIPVCLVPTKHTTGNIPAQHLASTALKQTALISANRRGLKILARL